MIYMRAQSRAILAALTYVICFSQSTCAQSLWEVTPYNVEIWVALEDHPEVAPSWATRLPLSLKKSSDTSLGAVWQTNATLAPPQYRQALLNGESPNAFLLIEANPSLAEADKLMIVSLKSGDGGIRVEARELDTATRVWSDIQAATCLSGDEIPRTAFQLLTNVFSPLAFIVRVEDAAVTAEVRAGALTLPESAVRSWKNPTVVQPGDFLLPYIRKTDRDGKVKENGVTEVKYTVLLVQSADSNGTLACEAHSGYRQAFTTRRSSRSRQLALIGRNTGRETVLHTHNRVDENIDLVGYDVFAREPGSEKSTLIGRTDWRGELVIPPADTPVRILFIKSGNRVLAKLPVVPGLQGRIEVALRDDNARLEAEGFLLGVQENLVDLVARREILSIRIRGLINKGQYDEADELLSELRQLPTRESFENLVTNRKQLLSTGDSQVQDKIDELFANTRDLFNKFLDPQRVDELQQQIRGARESGPPPAEAEITSDEATSG
ncbi:MAG: hypothetical protein KDB27_03690 [Planctomycetales bacterium]|nr:hypothetical protein [Planctomycetales bacterium]